MTEKQPLISVIMPVYNQKKEYLKKAIFSVLDQTFRNLELIIVDDGSDKLVKLEDYLLPSNIESRNVKLIRKENGGVASALNAGINAMKGQWFAWLSSDDIWTPDKLHKQVDYKLKNPDAKVIYSDWEYIDENGNHMKYETEPIFKNLEEVQFHLCHKFFGCGSTIMIQKEVFDKVGKFNEEYRSHEDYEMWFRIAKEYMFHKVPLVLMQYREHGKALRYTANAIGGTFNKVREDGRKLLDYYGKLDKVSIVIAAYNVENTICGCLDIVLNTRGVDEVFVIDDASTDNTRKILDGFSHPNLIIINNAKNMGRAITRNKGLKKAKNHLIATIDGDIIPDFNWLAILKKKMENMWLDVCGGSVRWKSVSGGYWTDYYDFYQTQVAKRSIGTCLTLFKRSALESVGFLDEALTSGEDSEMMFRMQQKGFQFYKIHDLLGTHIEERNLFDVIKRHYEYGVDRAIMVKKHPDKVKGQFNENETQHNPAEIVNILQELLKLIGTLGFREEYLKDGR